MTAEPVAGTPAWTGGLWAAVARTAMAAPDDVAVEHGDVRISYARLVETAASRTGLLRAHGVRRGDVVAVSAERLTDLVPALLGVLGAGAAYLPMDPGWPPARTAQLFEAAGVAAVLADRPPQATGGPAWLPLDRQAPANGSAPDLAVSREDLAAVLFTSGSTGAPKPVGLTHGGLLSRFTEQPYLRPVPGDRVAQLGNAGFDILSFEVWGTLLAGATVVGFTRPDRLSGAELAECLRRTGTTVAHLTSAWLAAVGVDVVTRSGSGLRAVLFGGESTAPETVRALVRAAPGVRLVHLYGPTETTSFATAEVTGADGAAGPVPIGRPLPDTDVFVVDGAGRPAPVGLPGEVLIGGPGVARGYLGRPGATAERFVPHPFAVRPGERAYRTGDIARWRHDGRLVFLGRRDHQVKLRGHRVEPQEVETHLRADDRVREAVVLLSGAGPDAQLVAYVVPVRSGESGGLGPSLTERLRGRLPAYLVPAHVVVLDRLPLTERGKLDRDALPAPRRADSAERAAAVPARTPLEHQLAGFFREVLGVAEVGVHDSFFDLGGHSVLAMKLASRMSAELDLEVPLRTLFDLPTVAQLAAEIEALDDEPAGVPE